MLTSQDLKSLLFLSSFFPLPIRLPIKMKAAPCLRSPRLAGGATARGAGSPAVATPGAAPGARATAAVAAPRSAAAAMALAKSASSSPSSPSRARVLVSRRSTVAAAASSVKTGEPAAVVSQADGQVRRWRLVLG